MSKHKRIFLSITVVFFILCVLFCAFLYENGIFSDIHYRFYKDDRITINLSVTIDGKFIKSDRIKADLTSNIISEKSGNNISVINSDSGVVISVKAGEYGEYLINTEICNYNFIFRAMQWNWWDVQNINLYIDIDTDKNKYKTYEKCSYISEEGNVVYDSEPEITYEISDINYISVGHKG